MLVECVCHMRRRWRCSTATAARYAEFACSLSLSHSLSLTGSWRGGAHDGALFCMPALTLCGRCRSSSARAVCFAGRAEVGQMCVFVLSDAQAKRTRPGIHRAKPIPAHPLRSYTERNNSAAKTDIGNIIIIMLNV